jgi:hypothetical protein
VITVGSEGGALEEVALEVMTDDAEDAIEDGALVMGKDDDTGALEMEIEEAEAAIEDDADALGTDEDSNGPMEQPRMPTTLSRRLTRLKQRRRPMMTVSVGSVPRPCPAGRAARPKFSL